MNIECSRNNHREYILTEEMRCHPSGSIEKICFFERVKDEISSLFNGNSAPFSSKDKFIKNLSARALSAIIDSGSFGSRQNFDFLISHAFQHGETLLCASTNAHQSTDPFESILSEKR